MELLFNQMSVDLKSTRELVRNVNSQSHSREMGFRKPGNLQYSQAFRGSSALRFEICCSRQYRLACISGGPWRVNLKVKSILPHPFLSIFLIDLFWIFGKNKDRVYKYTHICTAFYYIYEMYPECSKEIQVYEYYRKVAQRYGRWNEIGILNLRRGFN